MTIDQIDEAVALRNHRKRFYQLREAAKTGTVSDFQISQINVWSIISAGVVREAIIAECDDWITKNEARLMELGVTFD